MKKISVIVFLAFSVFASSAQLLRQPISNFTPREYGQQYSSYTLAVAEDGFGMIYFGTADGILQYDGVSWRSIPVKTGSYVTSLAANNGKIFVGSHSDFGYLEANELGELEYISLTKDIPENVGDFTAIKKILVVNNTVVFQAEELIFLYENNSITAIHPQTSFHLAFVCNNKLFARERNSGLLVFSEKEFSLIQGGDIFEDFGVFAILPYKLHSALIVTLELGLWELNKKGLHEIVLPKSSLQLINDAELIGGVKLDDGNYALISFKRGVIVLDSTLNLVANYNVNNGMLTSEVLDIIQDRSGNLWSATQKGATRIQYTSPFSLFNQSVGLFGSVQAVADYKGTYLVGTTEGLFLSEPDGQKIFTNQPSISGSVWAMEKSPSGVWITGSNGLWFYDGGNFLVVNRNSASALLYIPHKKWIIVAGASGFTILDEPSRSAIKRIQGIRTDSYGLAYKVSEKSNTIEIWMGSRTSGVWQLFVSPSLDVRYTYYSIEDGLPPDWVCAYQAGDDVLFATSRNGMLRFISPEELNALLIDESDDFSDLKGYFDIVDFPKHSHDKAVTAFNFSPTVSYAALDYHINKFSAEDSIPSNFLFKTLELGRLNVIGRADDALLIGGDDGLALVKSVDKKDRAYPVPDLLIRSITIGLDSLIWLGDKHIESKTFVIPYSMNSIEVELASTYFDNGFTASYSWRFKGVDDTYSRWSPQNTVTLPNLNEGDYHLMMVARNIHGDISDEQVFMFRILPPWYRTWWAFALYSIFASVLIYGLIQFNIRRLKEQNRRLEEIVEARTKEVVEQKDHIQHILQDIQSSINYAQRIQQALLPSAETISECLPNHFIIFHPRDVVSGDFYWATRINEWVIITVADCTGHGVPGAFMSMLGISFLNEIVRKKEVVSAAIVLDQLRNAIVESLKQTGKQNEQKDGMDMSIVAINLDKMVCYWAGANNPLYIVRKGEPVSEDLKIESNTYRLQSYDGCYVKEIKGDKMPVAIHTVMEPYTSHEVKLLKGDRLFLFTDGFADQFGGPNYRKFLAKNFRELIAKTSHSTIQEQGKEIDAAFKQWVSHNEGYEQIDDVTVMGIEIVGKNCNDK